MKKAKKVRIKLKPLTETEKTRMYRLAGEVLNGLLASRGQYPLNTLESQAAEFAKTAKTLAKALIKEIEEGN